MGDDDDISIKQFMLHVYVHGRGERRQIRKRPENKINAPELKNPFKMHMGTHKNNIRAEQKMPQNPKQHLRTD